MQEDIIKITSAVYSMLEVFPDAEPLKHKTKEKALFVLEHATSLFESHGWVSLKDYVSPDRQKQADLLLGEIDILQSYLKLGQSQGWIDNVNFLIIAKQYQLLRGRVASLKTVSNKAVLPTDVVSVQPPVVVKEKKVEKVQVAEVEDYPDRQKKILKILSKKGQAQVADLLKEIPNITKRTLRRDMDSLLQKRRVARIGQFNQVFYKIRELSDRTS